MVDSNAQHRFHTTLSFLEEKNATNFNAKDLIRIMQSEHSAHVYYKTAVGKMVQDGLITADIFDSARLLLKELRNEEFDWECDTWFRGNNSAIEWTEIENIEWRNILKDYVRIQSDDLQKKLPSFRYIKILASLMKEVGITKPSMLNNQTKWKFYIKLKDLKGVKTQSQEIVRIFRQFIKTMQNIKDTRISQEISLKGDPTFKNDSQRKIITFTDDEQKKILDYIDNMEDRIIACALGFQLLSARRIGEIVQSKNSKPIQKECIVHIGTSKLKAFKYHSAKQNKIFTIPLQMFVAGRADLFGIELEQRILAWHEEALKITEGYRRFASNAIKNNLFIEMVNSVVKIVTDKRMREAFNEMKKALKLNKALTTHSARHHMATSILLSGDRIEEAADALGDNPKTVAKYYFTYISNLDSLRLAVNMERNCLIKPLSDAKQLIEKQKINVVTQAEFIENEKRGETFQTVVGGKCGDTVENMMQCKSYRMIHSEQKCLGCGDHTIVAEVNKEYWEKQKKISLAKMQDKHNSKNIRETASIEYQDAKNVLEIIKQKEIENEFS